MSRGREERKESGGRIKLPKVFLHQQKRWSVLCVPLACLTLWQSKNKHTLTQTQLNQVAANHLLWHDEI